MPEPSLIEYPTDFPIKVMGKNEPGFEAAVIDAVLRHAPDFDPQTILVRPSKKDTYLSITCEIQAVSREQLDALYMELNALPMVVMML